MELCHFDGSKESHGKLHLGTKELGETKEEVKPGRAEVDTSKPPGNNHLHSALVNGLADSIITHESQDSTKTFVTSLICSSLQSLLPAADSPSSSKSCIISRISTE